MPHALWPFLLAILLLTTGAARAGDAGVELEVLAGWGQSRSADVAAGPLDTRLDLATSRLLGVAARYRLSDQVAVGLEYSRDTADLDAFEPLPVAGDISYDALMAIGEYRFGAERLRPFIGIGLGWGRPTSDASAATIDFKASDDVFMAQAMAGLRYQLFDTVSLMGQVRYRYANDAELRVGDQLRLPLGEDQFLLILGATIAF